jgi:uridylate kinase
VIEKIIESGLKTYYKEVCLLEQAFVHDNAKSVAQEVKESEGKIGAPVKITGFVRYALGEGIDKQESDFAAEVGRQRRNNGRKCSFRRARAGAAALARGKRLTMAEPVYRRVVIKLSGEYFAGEHSFGMDQPTIDRIAGDLIAARQLGVRRSSSMATTWCGRRSFSAAYRPTGDTMGMLATVMNCLALEAAIERRGAPARALSAFVMPQVCELYTRGATHKYLAEGRIVLLGGGTGNPFFTTDTTAVLRAAEIGAHAVLKATNVDGVYTADPKKDPSAKRFDRLTHSQAIEGGYKVMDATAFALARETSLPIIVFSIAEPGSIGAILRGTGHGTIVAG